MYWGNHPLLRNGANTWSTPPYQTPLNRWTPNLQSQDTGNHAEAATWSGHTGSWTCTGGITPSTILPQSTHLFTPPFEEKVKNFVHIKRSVPWWTGTAVELEAKGQASAQSTTGTVTLEANKRKGKKNNDT